MGKALWATPTTEHRVAERRGFSKTRQKEIAFGALGPGHEESKAENGKTTSDSANEYIFHRGTPGPPNDES
jgi:hypothetical protein